MEGRERGARNPPVPVAVPVYAEHPHCDVLVAISERDRTLIHINRELQRLARMLPTHYRDPARDTCRPFRYRDRFREGQIPLTEYLPFPADVPEELRYSEAPAVRAAAAAARRKRKRGGGDAGAAAAAAVVVVEPPTPSLAPVAPAIEDLPFPESKRTRPRTADASGGGQDSSSRAGPVKDENTAATGAEVGDDGGQDEPEEDLEDELPLEDEEDDAGDYAETFLDSEADDYPGAPEEPAF